MRGAGGAPREVEFVKGTPDSGGGSASAAAWLAAADHSAEPRATPKGGREPEGYEIVEPYACVCRRAFD